MRSRELFQTARLSAITGMQILLSVVMQWYIVSKFGAGTEADALYAGAIFFQLAKSLVLDSFRVVLTPLLSDKAESELASSAWSFFWVLAGSSALLWGAVYAAIPWLVPLTVPGFSAHGKQLTLELSRIQAAGIIGAAAYSVLATLCVVRNRFTWPPLANLGAAVISCVTLFLFHRELTIQGAGWVMTAYFSLPALLLLPVLGKPERPMWRAADLRRLWHQLRPLIVGRAYAITGLPVDRMLVSFMPAGTLAIYEVAGRISNVILNILDVSTVTPALPRLSRLASGERWTEFRSVALRKAIESCVVSFGLMGAIYGVLVVCRFASAHGMMSALLGKLGAHDLSYISVLVIYMGAILPFTAIGQVLSAAFCARRNTKTLTVIGAVVFTVALPLRAGLFFLLHVPGLVVATGISGIAYCVVLWRKLHPVEARALTLTQEESDPVEV